MNLDLDLDLGPLGALPIAAADLAVGGVLARHVSVPLGAVLLAVGAAVLCTAAYRTVRRSDPVEAGRRHPT